MPQATKTIIIKTVLRHYPGVQGIYLFGSYGTKQECSDNDIDIALLLPPEGAKQEKNLLLSRCRFDLEEVLRKDVDLLNVRLVSTIFQKEIVGNGRLIYAADQYAVDEFEYFRSLVIHQYQQADAEIVEQVIVSGLDDLIIFGDRVLEFMEGPEISPEVKR